MKISVLLLMPLWELPLMLMLRSFKDTQTLLFVLLSTANRENVPSDMSVLSETDMPIGGRAGHEQQLCTDQSQRTIDQSEQAGNRRNWRVHVTDALIGSLILIVRA